MTQIKHIAILTDNFPPCSGGGIAEWALGIAENLSEMGFEVSVLSRWKKQVPTDDHIGKPYTLHCMYGRDWNTRRFWFVLYYLWKFLKTHPDALILATTWELAHPMVILKRFFPEAKYVVIAHGREVTKLKKPRELKLFRETVLGAVLSIAVSRYTKQEIQDRLGAGHARVEFL
jgi:phosphatidylinositol alpha-1,6-mannosyltransferase